MTTWFGSFPALLGAAAIVLAPGCGNTNNSMTAGASATDSSSSTASTSETGTTASGSNSEGNTDGSSEGTGSASMTSAPTTTDPTTSMTSMTASSGTTEETTSTTAPSTATETSSSGTTDPGTTDPGTTGSTSTGTSDSDSTTTDGITSSSSSTTGPDCIPSPEVCNDLDDDCNDVVDDVDVGGDGICDCLDIAIFGNEGANPSAEFQTWLEAQGTQVDRISLDNTPITQQILDKYDIVILDWLVRSYTPEEAALIEQWVSAGGGLMSMTGHVNNNTVIDRPNSIIGPMGLSYNGSQGFFSGPVTQWTPHPLTMGITSVSFYGGLYINIVDDGVGVNEVIGTLPQGPVAVAQVRNDGKLFIFGDEWIEFDSEWQQIPQIKQFWVNILGWLSPQNFCTIPQ